MEHQGLFLILFNIVVFVLLLLDLGVMNKHKGAPTIRHALLSTAFFVLLALLFNAGIWYFRGAKPALEFTAGYLLEESLSIDNLFVFILIFKYFRVPGEHQHRILFWGILGALILRGIFIAAGVTLIHRFHFLIYLFGAFLVFTGIKMILEKDGEQVDPEKNLVLRIFHKFFPVSKHFHHGCFFLRENGVLKATPLFVVLLVVESTDVLFATDSIPAVLSVTLDPFIVYTSNVFAILGLRSLYFAFAAIVSLFRYLHHGVSLILIFVGVKMLTSKMIEIPIGVSLGILAGIITVSIALSVLIPEKKAEITEVNSEK
ncbi:MAG: TerC family protein [Candidatus Wallbacteria bacterium]|nr:TerC family protein [Candidatus Wallbacteria bacterium]